MSNINLQGKKCNVILNYVVNTWRFAGGPMMTRLSCYLDTAFPFPIHQTKIIIIIIINVVKVGPPLTKLSGSAHDIQKSESHRLLNIILRRSWIHTNITTI